MVKAKSVKKTVAVVTLDTKVLNDVRSLIEAARGVWTRDCRDTVTIIALEPQLLRL